VDESLTVPRVPLGEDGDPLVEHEDEFGRVRMVRRSELPSTSHDPEDDPVIEYEDEFGRMRTARRSEVPRHLLPQSKHEDIAEDESVLCARFYRELISASDSLDLTPLDNPSHHFPVYEPDANRVATIEKEYAEATAPLNQHYDASREVRAKGAGFYQFSADEETRRKQMEELKQTRLETERARQAAGAVDVRPGEMEGMRDDGEAGRNPRSRAMDKRKRELEERRKLLDAKRRKVKGASGAAESSVVTTRPGTDEPTAVASAPMDPFAALEAQTAAKNNQPSSSNPADDFLAQLERDIMKGK
jgi:hypothetical protein